jgi:hypothetical protein
MKDEKEFEFDDEPSEQLDCFDFEKIKIDMEDNYIEIHCIASDGIITLHYCGRLEKITISGSYEPNAFATTYPQLDARVLSAIASVFVDLRYYGHDFYSGDFTAALRNWLERFVFNEFYRKDVDFVKYIIEKETKSLLRDLSKTRLHKCWDNDQFTPLIWASPEQIKKQYERHLHFGRYEKHEEQ